MAGNNSCGSRSIRYGNMVHNVAAIDAVLADGERARFGSARPEDVPAAVRAHRRQVAALAFAERDEIERLCPKVLRRVGGYNLDIFFPQSRAALHARQLGQPRPPAGRLRGHARLTDA